MEGLAQGGKGLGGEQGDQRQQNGVGFDGQFGGQDDAGPGKVDGPDGVKASPP